MNWLPLRRFRDPAVPKLDNLRRAEAAGLRVPPTWWRAAADLDGSAPPALPPNVRAPFILRSGSPTEDARATSNAGQLVSRIVAAPAEYGPALAEVLAALPVQRGLRQGAVFLQPLVRGREAGVAFFDGFYYERTLQGQSGGDGALNTDLTAGLARGEVTRGHLERDEPWSDWLAAL